MVPPALEYKEEHIIFRSSNAVTVVKNMNLTMGNIKESYDSNHLYTLRFNYSHLRNISLLPDFVYFFHTHTPKGSCGLSLFHFYLRNTIK